MYNNVTCGCDYPVSLREMIETWTHTRWFTWSWCFMEPMRNTKKQTRKIKSPPRYTHWTQTRPRLTSRICRWRTWTSFLRSQDNCWKGWVGVVGESPVRRCVIFLETRCGGEGVRCGTNWMTLEGRLMRSNLHPYLPVESVDDDHESPVVRQFDNMIGCDWGDDERWLENQSWEDPH